MVEERGHHNVAPSLSGEAVANLATPPSQLAAANASASAAATAAAAAAAAPLQERPKYVYGAPVPAQDSAEGQATEASNGAYSADPQAQTSYNAEAYGSYAKYDDAGQGVVGGAGVAVGGVYQDAEREYQGQQGYYDQNQQQQYQQGYYDQNQQYYDQTQQAYYEQSQQAQYVVDGQYAQQYDYSQQQQQYAAGQPAYPAAQPEQHQATGYQPPHPYANGSAGSNAYGGM